MMLSNVNHHKFWAIVPAAGVGSRFGGEKPKQYAKLLGKTVIEHALQPFLKHDWIKKVVVPISQTDTFFEKLEVAKHPKIEVTIGGETRVESVLNGLKALPQAIDRENEWVLVHDAARPCLKQTDLEKLVKAVLVEKTPAAGILATPVTDTIKSVKLVDRKLKIEETCDRSKLWRALTPQMFKAQNLQTRMDVCVRKGELAFTDDASVYELFGLHPIVVPGCASNIKITQPSDLLMASSILESRLEETLACV